MSTYSEAMSPLDVYSDTKDEVDTNSDTKDIEVNSDNDIRTDRDVNSMKFNHGNGVCSEQGKREFHRLQMH